MLDLFPLLATAALALGEGATVGRLLDALTGAPVAGATLEAWTEGWEHEALLVLSTASDAGGGFALELDPAAGAEKLRVRAPGYRGTTLALTNVDGDLPLLPGPAPIAVRVLDLQGRPIAGARLTTHQTCAHAPPAAEATSGLDGVLLVPDFPPFSHFPEVRIEADGFEALHGVELERLLCPRGAEPPTLRLARRTPIAAHFVDARGLPVADLRVVAGYAPEWQARRTDAEGRVAFPSPFDRRTFLHTVEGGQQPTLLETWPREGPAPRVRVDGELRRGGEATLEIQVEGNAAGLPLLALHEDGWWTSETGAAAFPPGRVNVRFGGAFSGWGSDSTEVEVSGDEPRTLVLRPVPEPVLTLTGLQPGDRTVVVEAGGDSDRTAAGAGEVALPVPAGRPLTIAIEASSGTWLLSTDGIADAATIHRDAFELADPARVPPDAVRAILAFEPGGNGRATPIQVFAPHLERMPEATGDAPRALALPPHTPFEVWIGAEDGPRRALVGASGGPGSTLALPGPR